VKPLVIVGDALLDRDVDGTADRLCPDAPVPVLAEESSVDRPGGAALAALMAAELGREVVLVTALDERGAGGRVRELLGAAGIEVHALPVHGPTPEKIRLRARGRVLLRLDRGGTGEPAGDPPPAALAALRAADAVLVSDYGNGMARVPALREAVAASNVLVWDPHPRGPAAVPGARLVTPNDGELRGLVSTPDGSRLAALAHGAAELRRRWRAGAVAVTLGAEGALLCHAGPTPLVIPAPHRASGDTCGAGDRFAATAAVALAGGALVSEAVQEAVAGATAYVATGGPAGMAGARTIDPGGARSPEEVVRAVRGGGGTVVASGGCFDLLHAGHVGTLQAARSLGDCLVVCLNSDASVRALKGPGRPVMPEADRARLLAALGCVDAVAIFDEPTPHEVLSRLRPDIWVKGGDYLDGASDGALPEAELVRQWGGQAVVVPYLAGRSTTRIIAAARSSARGPSQKAE